MKIYTKIILDKNNNLIEQEYFNYSGSISHCGIHYTYGANRNAKKMEKQARREKKLADRRAKRAAKDGIKETKQDNSMHDITKPITLADITDPKKKWKIKKKI